jgi:hypothetical protein
MDAPRRGSLGVSLRDLAARHQLKVVSGALLLVVVAFVFFITRDDVPPPPRVEPPVDAGPLEVPAFEVLAKIEEKPVTTKKGRLMKDRMKKRLEERSGASGSKGGASGGGTKVATGGESASIDVALTGDAELRRAVQKKLRGGVRVVDEGAGSGRYLASLSMTTGEAKGGVIYAKCSAAMSELPQRKLVGSLSNRADVSGEGSDDNELRAAAKSSCADSLADDVAQWVRARR